MTDIAQGAYADPNETPPMAQAIPLGFQHVLAMFASNVTPSIIVAGAAGLAFGGLVWLLWPGGGAAPSLPHALAMLLAGVGWGVYSLAGRKAEVALVSTAANFVLATGLGLVVLLGLQLSGSVGPWSLGAVVLAVVSGAVTSGLGYALWYAVLPRLPGSVAAVAQLTVPVIAMAGGMVFLGEALTARFALAALLVLGGVAVSVVPLRRG